MEVRITEAQAVIDLHCNLLDDAEEMDTPQAVAFMAGICDATDLLGVDSRAEKIVSGFERLAFFANARCRDGSDPDIYGRWLVGQAMDCLATSPKAIHQVFWKFFEEYQEMLSAESSKS